MFSGLIKSPTWLPTVFNRQFLEDCLSVTAGKDKAETISKLGDVDLLLEKNHFCYPMSSLIPFDTCLIYMSFTLRMLKPTMFSAQVEHLDQIANIK